MHFVSCDDDSHRYDLSLVGTIYNKSDEMGRVSMKLQERQQRRKSLYKRGPVSNMGNNIRSPSTQRLQNRGSI